MPKSQIPSLPSLRTEKINPILKAIEIEEGMTLIRSTDDFAPDDFRRNLPKFQGEQFYRNIELVKAIKNMAEEKNITSSQLAIAWVATKGYIPIPGTKRVKYVEQNIEASKIRLTSDELAELESIIPLGTITGDRYDAANMAVVGK